MWESIGLTVVKAIMMLMDLAVAVSISCKEHRSPWPSYGGCVL